MLFWVLINSWNLRIVNFNTLASSVQFYRPTTKHYLIQTFLHRTQSVDKKTVTLRIESWRDREKFNKTIGQEQK